MAADGRGRDGVGSVVSELATLERAYRRAIAGLPIHDPTTDPRAPDSGPLARLAHVVAATGAPAASAIESMIAAEDDRQATRRAVTVAASQARAVAILLVAAPVILVPGLGSIVGVDIVAFYRSPAGIGVALVGGGMVMVGIGVIIAVVRRAAVLTRPRPGDAGRDEVAELLAVTLAAGVPLPLALRIVGCLVVSDRAALIGMAMAIEMGTLRCAAGQGQDDRASQRHHDLSDPDVASDADHDPLVALIRDAWHLGTPIAAALRRYAARERAEDRAGHLARVERLPVVLAVPTVLLLLPGTVLLLGAPIVLGSLRSLAA